MKRAGVIGWPVAHSLSPVLHGYWLNAYCIEGSYRKIAATPEDFAAAIARLRDEGFTGVNVTVPHKEAAFALAGRKDASAVAAGAANLLVFGAGGIEARNTDVYGLSASLAGQADIAGKPVILLGAGGAARGALLALRERGAAHIHLLNRSLEKARALADDLNLPSVTVGALADWAAVAPQAKLVVNATSAGMGGNPPLDLDLSLLPQDAAVCDIVYHPLETRLLKDAKARGLLTIDGLGMLMHQAVPSFEAFFGLRPEVTPGLRAHLVAALHDR